MIVVVLLCIYLYWVIETSGPEIIIWNVVLIGFSIFMILKSILEDL